MNSDNIYASNCGCKKKHNPPKQPAEIKTGSIPTFPDTVEYGQAYVPYQADAEKIYTPESALSSGTIFPELDKPYVKKRRCGCE